MTAAVYVDNVSKKFRFYRERNLTLKSAIMRGRTSVYEDFWALRNVSFEVPAGSSFGLIGSNGSGKSTLLKCLAKIYYPNEGSITTAGRIAALLEIGTGFHQELSGRENVFLNGSILGMSRKDILRKLDEIVDFAGIEKFIDQPVKNYSTGMYVRLGFAIAINVAPDVLIVDEVLSVGDSEFQEKCAQKFVELRRSGATLIIVSHSMETLRGMCDNAAWLDKGNLMAVGEANSTITAYQQSRTTPEG